MKTQRAEQFETFADAIEHHARISGDAVAYRFLDGQAGAGVTLTFAELRRRCLALARALEGTPVGSRVAVICRSAVDFVPALCGCLWSGWVAVPLSPARGKAGSHRLTTCLADCQAAAVVGDRQSLALVPQVATSVPAMVDVNALEGAAEELARPRFSGADLALLQYTSGSTAAPKGVRVTHRNLLANMRMLKHAFRHDSETRVASWLPLYHDMGLIGTVLHPLYLGVSCALLSPLDFIRSPRLWLQIISEHRATSSGAPNFAYELCINRISDGALEGLDLSRWRVAFCGAEPVRERTLRRFAEKFAPVGFRPEAFYPCYGMAEATLFSAGPRPGAPFKCVWLDPQRLEQGQAVALEAARGGRAFVSCGSAGPEWQHRIVCSTSHRALSPGRVGEIWISGDHVCDGYWNAPEQSERTFRAQLADAPGRAWLRTGDLGFELDDGELVITGRSSDVLIVNGRNLYAHDLELSMRSAAPELSDASGVAFAVEDGLRERIVLLQEPRRGLTQVDVPGLCSAIRRAVAADFGISNLEVRLTPTGQVPLTTSGKVMRQLSRTRYLAGEFSFLAERASGAREGS